MTSQTTTDPTSIVAEALRIVFRRSLLTSEGKKLVTADAVVDEIAYQLSEALPEFDRAAFEAAVGSTR